jgi:hypothetical protein
MTAVRILDGMTILLAVGVMVAMYSDAIVMARVLAFVLLTATVIRVVMERSLRT